MLRSIPFIIAALAEIGITGGTAKVYAPILQDLGVKHNLDPITIITTIKGESGNNTKIVNSIGCVGLGQVCLSNYRVCQKGNDPDTYNAAKCQAKKRYLQSGPNNLRTMASGITANRRYCNKKMKKRGRARNQWRHWFPSYGGYNNFGKKWAGVWCGQKRVKTKRGYKWVDVRTPKRIRTYMARRKAIIQAVSRKLYKRRKPRRRTKRSSKR